MSHLHLLKGHGTGNDFIFLLDDEGRHDLSADFVQKLCDRRFGIGADGLIRVVRTRFAAESEIQEFADRAEWFMDYRNADGSIASMCGNGARVFAHLLHSTGRVGEAEFLIMTRAGLKWASRRAAGIYAIEMGRATTVGEKQLKVSSPIAAAALGVLMPNPHAVVQVADLNEVGALLQAPQVEPAEIFPDGVNVEFVHQLSPNHLQMRVFERGVGETLSCGTGACAAAHAAVEINSLELPVAIQVSVPGGDLSVEFDIAGEITLVGPAELVAEFNLNAEWLSHRGKM